MIPAQQEARISSLRQRAEHLFKDPESGGEALRAVHDKLLSLGGHIVAPLPEQDAQLLLDRGEEITFEKIFLKTGESSECHGNVALLALNDKVGQIVTGYGLTFDPDGLGCWRQHSWGLRGTTIIETTQKRAKYFGVRLDDIPSLGFILANATHLISQKEVVRRIRQSTRWSRTFKVLEVSAKEG